MATKPKKPNKKELLKAIEEYKEREVMNILKQIQKGIKSLLSNKEKPKKDLTKVLPTAPSEKEEKMAFAYWKLIEVVKEVQSLSTIGMTLKNGGGSLNRINQISGEVLNLIRENNLK